MRHVAVEAGAYWLIDAILISSRCRRLQQRCNGLEFWTLTVKDGAAELVCTDGGMNGDEEHVVYSQQIPHTDFPLATIDLYLDGGILCLPGER